jgi:hypothetical protein
MATKQTEEIREEYEISDGSPNKVIVTYVYLGPTPAPSFGDEWDECHDRHIVGVTLVIPHNEFDTRLDYLVCPTPYISRDAFLFNTKVDDASVMGAFHRCKQMATEIVETLRSHVARREARLRERNARLQRGKIGSPFKHAD